jgi:putative acetyltransferase
VVAVGKQCYSMAMFHLRPATPVDAAACFTVWQRAVAATHDFLTPADAAAIAAEVEAMLPATPMTLAVDAADQPLGFMILDGAQMEALFIHPDHHGKGIGKALVAHAMALHGRLTTDVNEQNHGAMAFYLRLGFRPTGRSPRDGQGRPYPLVHLRLEQPAATA